MKKIITILLLMSMLFCLAACNQNSTSLNSEKGTENITVDENYTEVLKLINTKEYEKAYKKIDNIKDKKIAEELKNKFVVIKDVLLSKTLTFPNDKLGNKIGPFIVTYSYDKNGNLVEINAENSRGIIFDNVFNPFMKYVGTVNYPECYEKLTYDDSNKLVKVTGYTTASSENIEYIANFAYDQSGRINKVEYVCNLDEVSTIFKYDTNGLLKTVERDWKYPNKTVNINYDENGNIIEDGTSYDDDGRVTESKCYYYASTYIEGKATNNYGDFYIYSE